MKKLTLVSVVNNDTCPKCNKPKADAILTGGVMVAWLCRCGYLWYDIKTTSKIDLTPFMTSYRYTKFI